MAQVRETLYNSYRFRSRLEARWALFFDTLGVKYEYEKEGYWLDEEKKQAYLPDFWLPDQDCWVEIKGQKPTEVEEEKAKLLALHTGKPVYLFFGQVWYPAIPRQGQDINTFLSAYLYGHYFFCWEDKGEPRTHVATYGEIRAILSESFAGDVTDITEFFQNIASSNDLEMRVIDRISFQWWTECPKCHKIGLASLGDVSCLPCKCVDPKEDKHLGHKTPRLIAAYTAARQARFEK